MAVFGNKTSADQRDMSNHERPPPTPITKKITLQQQKLGAQEQPLHYENAKKRRHSFDSYQPNSEENILYLIN